jgi:hypothetical protein
MLGEIHAIARAVALVSAASLCAWPVDVSGRVRRVTPHVRASLPGRADERRLSSDIKTLVSAEGHQPTKTVTRLLYNRLCVTLRSLVSALCWDTPRARPKTKAALPPSRQDVARKHLTIMWISDDCRLVETRVDHR